ncbi:hypothetical protein HZC34_04675 [Candidatus Saganbacteria bacterium]|nr:hypothetical protein [Candidatus Saganbacteria bacterium]
MRFALGVLFLIFLSPALAANMPAPQWGEKGITINSTPGNTVQQHPKVAKIGSSEYAVVFEDFRSGNSGLYLQKINESGNLLWDKKGSPATNLKCEHLYPQILSNNSNEAYIVWQDNRSNTFNVYLQKIDLNGNSIFPQNGIRICGTTEYQVFPEMILAQDGGVIISWVDYRSKEEDIYAQKVSPNGEKLWGENGAPVCTLRGTQWSQKIVQDGSGGAIIVWADRRSGDFDIYAQHLDPSGKALWPINGIAVCKKPGNQENPKIVQNGLSGAYIAWSENGADEVGIYVQNMDPFGRQTFGELGVKASKVFLKPGAFDIGKDNNNNAILAWSDSNAGDPDIYMQKISSDGTLLLGDEGLPVARIGGAQEDPKIFGTAKLTVVWEDLRGNGRQLFIQEYNEDTVPQFSDNGMPISLGQHNARSADIDLSSDMSALILYQDDKHGNFDIYAQKLTNSGGREFGDHGMIVNNAIGSVMRQNMRARADNKNNIFAVFEDKRSGQLNVYAQKIGPSGKLLWGKNAVPVGALKTMQVDPDVVPDHKGGAYIVWEDFREAQPMIYFQHFNEKGEAQISHGARLTPWAITLGQKKPRIITDQKNGAIVVFVDDRSNLNEDDIYAQRISFKDNSLLSKNGKLVSAGNGNQGDPRISPRSLIITWTDYRAGDRNSDIYAQKIDLSLNTKWEEDGIPICQAPDSQRDPAIIDDGKGGAIITWTDKGGGNYDIYAQRVNKDGQVLWIKDGVPVCQEGGAQQQPKIVPTNPGESFIAWEDFRFSDWDIYAQSLDGQGRIGANPDGIPVCRLPGTQYSHDVARYSDKILTAWEDYRNQNKYNIYLQAFSLSGEKILKDGGILIDGTQNGGRTPQLAPLNDKEFVLVWEDRADGRHDLSAQKFRF